MISLLIKISEVSKEAPTYKTYTVIEMQFDDKCFKNLLYSRLSRTKTGSLTRICITQLESETTQRQGDAVS